MIHYLKIIKLETHLMRQIEGVGTNLLLSKQNRQFIIDNIYYKECAHMHSYSINLVIYSKSKHV